MTGKHSKLWKFGYPVIAAPDADELKFVQAQAKLFETAPHEMCAIICRQDTAAGPQFQLTPLATQGAYGGCGAGSPSKCAAGYRAVSDIHGHPSPGTYYATQGDMRLGIASRGTKITITKSDSEAFSHDDLSVSAGQKLNSWVVPHGTSILIYHPLSYPHYGHSEYQR